MIFGELTQSRLIMEKNFEGKQFLIKDKRQAYPKIDCMFFPSTQGDDVVLDPEENALPKKSHNRPRGGSHMSSFAESSAENRQRYLQKSTIIMCNPNALIYQWMITQANAYWLDFFLRRDCNVLIWNYRGYGETEQEMLAPNLTPD